MSSQGFSNRNCILQYSPLNHQECFTRNKRNFCFQIWPKLSYDARHEYEEQLKFFEETFGEQEEETNIEGMMPPETPSNNAQEGDKDKEGAPESVKDKQSEANSQKGSEKPNASNREGSVANSGKDEQNEAEDDGDKPEGEEELEEDIIEQEEETGVGTFFASRQDGKKEKVQTATMKRERDNFKLKIRQLLRKLKDENEINEKTYKFKAGKYVEYGADVQLLHVDSGSFVQAQKTCADDDSGCNKVDLAI